MKTIKSFGIALLLLLVSTTVSAQCTFRNTAFKSGEFLTYNLYYNWKFVWVKAGNASMSIVQTTVMVSLLIAVLLLQEAISV